MMTRIPLRFSLPVSLPAHVVVLIVLLASNVLFLAKLRLKPTSCEAVVESRR
jgi:hypothetical protein